MSQVERSLSQGEVSSIRGALSAMAQSATSATKAFTFVASFDGTYNDRDRLYLSRTPQETIVAQLSRQLVNTTSGAPGVGVTGGYYPGVGTGGPGGGDLAAGPWPTAAVVAIARRALNDFARQADAWLAANPDKTFADLSTTVIAFSRGSAVGIVFAQLLEAEGLRIGNDIIAPPHSVDVSGTLLFEPVVTGVDRSMVLPANMRGNIFVVNALDESRYHFALLDLINDNRVQTFGVWGNHGDIGNFYDNGIGAIVQEYSTLLLRATGLPMMDVTGGRSFDASQPVNVHTEAYRDIIAPGELGYSREQVWPESGSGASRRRLTPPRPELTDGPSANVLGTSVNSNSDGTSTRVTIFVDGQTQTQLLVEGGRIVLQGNLGQSVIRDANGRYSLASANGERTTFDPVTGQTTLEAPNVPSMVFDLNGRLIKLPDLDWSVDGRVVIGGEALWSMPNGLLFRLVGEGQVEIRSPEADLGGIFNVASDGSVAMVGSYASAPLPDGSAGRVLFDETGDPIGTVEFAHHDNGSYSMLLDINDVARLRSDFTTAGNLVTRSEVSTSGRALTQSFDLDGTVSGTITDTPDANGGIVRVVDTEVDGRNVQVTQHVDAGLLAQDLNQDGNFIDPGDAVTTGIMIGGVEALNSDLLGHAFDAHFADALTFVYHRDSGLAMQLAAAGDRANPTGSRPLNVEPGLPWEKQISRLSSTLTSAQALAAAIDSGDSLGISTSIFNLVDAGSGGLRGDWGYVGSGLNGATALMGLKAAFERGDVLGVVRNGLAVSKSVLTGYKLWLDQQISIARAAGAAGSTVEAMQIESANVGNWAEGVGDALTVISVYLDIKSGDYVGAGLTAWAASSGNPYVIVAAMIWDFAQAWEEPDLHGEARLVAGGTDGTQVSVVATGELGGDRTAGDQMSALLASLRSAIAGSPQHGILANRVPELRYSAMGFHLTVQDPDTLQISERTFDLKYRLVGETLNGVPVEIAGSKHFYRDLYEQFVQAALQAGAVVPLWEVQTAYAQQQHALPQAGLTTLQRARLDGTLLPANTAGNTQPFRPIVLDLAGDGIHTTDAAKGGVVLFDVDDDGWAEETNWVSPRDAILVLDRNGDGSIDRGHELFSDAGVDTARRGLAALAEVDADGDSRLTAADPVFEQLRAWQDIDADGVAQAYELQSLADLGITQLDFSATGASAGTFTVGGVNRPMAQVTLTADTEGAITQVRDNGLWVLREGEGATAESDDSDGQMYATTAQDLSRSSSGQPQAGISADGTLTAGYDGLKTPEDTPLSIPVAHLLANDGSSVAGLAREALVIVSVATDATSMGTVSLRPDLGVVVFTPAANYYGQASFSYTLSDGRGQTATARVNVDVSSVNDAPTAHNVPGDAHLQFDELVAVPNLGYGFSNDHELRLGSSISGNPVVQIVDGITWMAGDGGAWQGGIRFGGLQYSLGRIGNEVVLGDGGVWRPVLKADAYIYSGTIVGSDVETPASGLRYEIVEKRMDHGEVTLNRETGEWTFSYTPHGGAVGITTNESDTAFTVRVLDGNDPMGFHDVEVVLGGRALDRWDIRESGDTLLPADWGQRRLQGVGGQGGGAGAAMGMGQGGAAAAAAAIAPPRRDPLALDLDGDGIETSSERDGAVVLFDHDGDGVRTGTGWLRPDDAWLALDLDSNGAIDTGRELFGVDTVLKSGATASDGYAALRDRDDNADGAITPADSIFAALRIWSDLNQDGVSQPGELSTLASNQIVSIGVNATPQRTDLGNGNVQTAVGSYRRSDGTMGASSDTEYTAGNLDLLVNTFQRSFTTQVPLVEQAWTIQPLRGSGQVRDLREAVSLSSELFDLVSTYNGQNDRAAQLGQLDAFIEAWANTSAMKSLKQQADALAPSGVQLNYILEGLAVGTSDYNAFVRKIGVVERFVGFTYAGPGGQPRVAPIDPGSGSISVALSSAQMDNIALAYERFKGDIYESSLLTSRLKPYADAIDVNVLDGKPRVDFSRVEAAFVAAIESDPQRALIDLIEFVSAIGPDGAKLRGWDALGFLTSQLGRASGLPALAEELSIWTVRFASSTETTLTGSARADLLVGTADGNDLRGGVGDDVVVGGGGNDALYGEAGNDTLDGGAGNDTLNGGTGNNTYLFGRGDGQDVVKYTADATAGKLNTLQFKAGVLPGEVVLKQVADNEFGGTAALEFSIAGTADKIVFNGFFYSNDPGTLYNGLQQVKFADGTTWDLAGIKAALFAGTAGGDALNGTIDHDVINGQAGADTLYGRNGNDSLNGGADNDSLYGENGNDTLDGGAGNDTLNGGTGNNTYLFGRGDGQDIVKYTADATAGKLNTLQFKAGVLPGEVVLRQVSDNEFGGTVALEFSIAGTTDKIVFNGFFYGNDPAGQYNGLQQVKFADGTTWDLAGIKAALFAGTAGGDALNGTIDHDVINGQAGADTLYGRNGNDSLNGGADNDSLYGENGNDTLDGGAGNDTLNGGTGNNTYLFGRGDGQDIVKYTADATAGKLNTLQFKASVLPGEVVLKQVADNEFGGTAALEFSIAGTADKIVFNGFFYNNDPGSQYNGLQQVRFADGTTWDLAAIQAQLFGGGTPGPDTLIGTAGPDALSGGAGNDILYGRDGDDTLNGGADNDTLYGEAGNDTLDGGAGNDTLNGGTGNNTYLFGRGDGQDVVKYTADATAGKLNTLQFKAGVLPGEVMLRQVADSEFGGNVALEFSIAGTADKIVFNGFFYGNDPGTLYNGLQQVRFADGTTWDLAGIKAALFAGTGGVDAVNGTIDHDVINGQAGADTLYGRNGNDTLNGGADNDSLYGENGNDTLDGGAGNDTLNGGSGNNTYLFGRGDGQDLVKYTADATGGKLNTLQFKVGVLPGEVQLKQVADSEFGGMAALEFSIAGTTDKIVFNGFFYSNDPGSLYNGLQQVKFADGTTWDLVGIRAALFAGTTGVDAINGTLDNDVIDGQAGADTLYGRNGNDSLSGGADNDMLYGENGNDTLDGGAGNDTLNGGTGNNTYLFGRGDGQDVVKYTADATAGKLNTLQFKAGVLPGEVVLRQVADSEFGGTAALEFSIAGTTDKIVFNGFFYSNDPGSLYNGLQQVRFADGTTWDLAGIKAALFAGTGGVDAVNGTIDHDVINGKAGADTLYGRNGNDSLSGGADNDTLYGENGNDTLDGGAGNDTLNGGSGNNTYLFGRGDGQDLVKYTADATAGKLNTLQFKAGVLPGEVVLRQVSDGEFGGTAALEFSIAGTADKIVFNGFFYNNDPGSLYNGLQQVKFADGTTWDLAGIKAALFAGTASADAINGTIDNDVISGQAGADTLYGRNGNDTLNGGADNDTLYGENGNDTLDGSAGNDTLNGGAGSDTYLFGPGSGADLASDYDSAAGHTDIVQLAAGLEREQLWFRRIGSDLEMSIIGTGDKLTIANWYAGSAYHLEQFRTAGGGLLLDSKVDALVSAMAAFAPPPAGQTTLAPEYQAALNPVIASSWG